MSCKFLSIAIQLQQNYYIRLGAGKWDQQPWDLQLRASYKDEFQTVCAG